MIDTNATRQRWAGSAAWYDVNAVCDELDSARRERDTLLLAVRRVLMAWQSGKSRTVCLMELAETVGTSDRLAATADAARRKDEAFQAMRALQDYCEWLGERPTSGGEYYAKLIDLADATLALADAAGK